MLSTESMPIALPGNAQALLDITSGRSALNPSQIVAHCEFRRRPVATDYDGTTP